MASTVLSVRILEQLNEQLDYLSRSTKRSKAYLAAEALGDYVKKNAWRAKELHRRSARPTRASSCRTRRWSPGSTHPALTRSSRHPSPTSVAPRRRRHEDCLALHHWSTIPISDTPPRAPTASMNYRLRGFPISCPYGSTIIASKSCGSFTNRKSGRPHGNRMMTHLKAP